MKQSRWARANVKCPFWRGDWEKAVACEAPIDDCGLTLTFRGRKKQMAHMETYCCRLYKYCEVYRMVQTAKYDE